MDIKPRKSQKFDDECFSDRKVFPRAIWSDPNFQIMYGTEVKNALSNVCFSDVQNLSMDGVKKYINKLCDDLCSLLHRCVSKCLEVIPQKRKHNSKSWWNTDCFKAKQRNYLFYHIWIECGRPLSGTVFENYKLAKKQYRKICRLAMNNKTILSQQTIGKLFHANKPAQMWNLIRRAKPKSDCNDAISMDTLCQYFSDKFAAPSFCSEELNDADRKIREKYNKLCNNCESRNPNAKTTAISVHKIEKYIKKLNNNCSPGLDGITGEHLKFALNTNLSLYLCHLLSVCIQYGIVPDSFRHGLLIPVIKKSTLNPSEGKSYRPITISVTFSKLLEYYILEECSNHRYSDFQFGFVPQRSTHMATVLAHDILEFTKSQGSSVFLCSLDAEGAFDAIPFSALFDSNDILPDRCWRIMYNWYADINVCLKWRNKMSSRIKIRKGTRQGDLTSPMMFNIFYQKLIEELNISNNGVMINNHKYNALCYADDILLMSTTVTGLQSLIDTAVKHITKKGLRFNPLKTECFIAGKNPFVVTPKWFIGDTPLVIKDSIKYLGTTLGNERGLSHVQARITNSNKAFYSLQGAGLYKNLTDPQVAVQV